MTFLELLNKVNSGEIDGSKVRKVRIDGQVYDATGLVDKKELNAEVTLLDKYNSTIDWSKAYAKK